MKQHNLFSTVYYAPFENNTEYRFDGSGYSDAGTYWEAPDSEMNLDKCIKYIDGDKNEFGDKRWLPYDIDLAIQELAAAETESVDNILDRIVQDLYDSAEPEQDDGERLCGD